MDTTQTQLATNPGIGLERNVAVSDALHPGDGMHKGNMQRYLSCGHDALCNIVLAQKSAGVSSPKQILDFACGFGRVARHLRVAFPNAEITFTDAMPDASAFCAKTFSGRDRPVQKDFSGYDPERRFDLIWVGSLFTHLPAAKSAVLYDLLFQLMSPGGLLVFTSHGRHVRDRRAKGEWPYAIDESQYDAMIEEADSTGYGFVGYKGSAEYGISLASLAWWERTINGTASEMVMLRERGWDRHQDVIAVKRVA